MFQTLALADDLDVPDNIFLGRETTKWDFLGPFRFLAYGAMRQAKLEGLERTAVKIPNIRNTIRNMSGGQRQCVAITRTATFHSKLTIMDEPTAALGVQETAQVENIIRNLKEQGEPLILISHNMRQVFDLVDRIVVFRRGRIVANLDRNAVDPEDVVAYITGARTGRGIRRRRVSKKRRSFWDVRSPILRPLWLRVLIVVVCAFWAVVEILSGSVFWAVIFAAAAVFLFVQLLVKFDQPTDT